MSRTRTKTQALQIHREAEQSLSSTANVADTAKFCDTLFDMSSKSGSDAKTRTSSIVSHVFEVLKAMGFHDGKRWKHFPKANGRARRESAMYGPFIDIANAIHQIIRDFDGSKHKANQKQLGKLKHRNLVKDMYGDHWRAVELVACVWDCLSNESPKSRDVDSPETRPDLSCVIPSEDRERLNREITDIVRKLDALDHRSDDTDGATAGGGSSRSTKASNKKKAAARKKAQQVRPTSQPVDREDLEKQLQTARSHLSRAMKNYWLQQHNTAELKFNCTPKDIIDSTTQTIGGAGLILREQLNRRFVFGLTLCRDQLAVWLCDRSGLLGTKTAIDIHENPERFVQILAGFSILSAERLGWDRTMQLYDPRTDQCLQPAYQSFDAKTYGKSVYDTHWIIEMPSKGNASVREKFLTVRCISAARADVISGRAVLIWEAVKFNERHAPKKIYVLKQSWRPSANPESSEAHIYEMMKNTEDEDRRFVASIYSSEDVLNESGSADDTETSIRRNLMVEEYEPPSSKHAPKRTVTDVEDDEKRVFLSVLEGDAVVIQLEAPTFPTPRVRTRILMEEYGWSIKFFINQLEFLCSLRDGMKGHRFGYVNEHRTIEEEDQSQGGRAVLHRDVSCGNLLICPENILEDNSRTEGRLIDFDHAKLSTGFTSINTNRNVDELILSAINIQVTVGSLPSPSPELVMKACARYYEIDPDTPIEALVGGVSAYLVSLYRNPAGNIPIDWLKKLPLRRPTFEGRVSSRHERTGTMPFVSAAVLKQAHVMPPGRAGRAATFVFRSDAHFHDAIHDIESFFWVFTYLCMTREGPGGERRDDFKPSPQLSEETKTLWHVVRCLFDDGDVEVLTSSKETMLSQDNALEEYIIPNISPYFRNLIPLLKRWWTLIVHVHRFHLLEYDTIHDRTLELLEDAISDLEKNPPQFSPELEAKYKKLSDTERERRQKDLRRIRECFRHSAPYTPPVTPIEDMGARDPSGISPETILGHGDMKGVPLGGRADDPPSPTPKGKGQGKRLKTAQA